MGLPETWKTVEMMYGVISCWLVLQCWCKETDLDLPLAYMWTNIHWIFICANVGETNRNHQILPYKYTAPGSWKLFVRCQLTKYQPNSWVCLCLLSFTTTASCFLTGWRKANLKAYELIGPAARLQSTKAGSAVAGGDGLIGAQQGWATKAAVMSLRNHAGTPWGNASLNLAPACTPTLPFFIHSPPRAPLLKQCLRGRRKAECVWLQLWQWTIMLPHLRGSLVKAAYE